VAHPVRSLEIGRTGGWKARDDVAQSMLENFAASLEIEIEMTLTKQTHTFF
jgi:hypothetical protein